MKRMGIFLVLSGLLCILMFALYKFAIEPEIPLLIKLGLTAAIVGLIIIIFTLIAERFFKKEKEDDNDLSKY